MLNTGQVVLRYRILGLLGRGETGVVYTAEDIQTRERVAVKVFEWGADDAPQTRVRLRKEAAAAQALHHPNICEIKSIEKTDGLLCIVMELLEGTPLDELIAEQPLPARTIAAYAIDIASALGAAHKRAILHHDLKPSKVVVSSAGVKVLDFGIGWILKQARGDRLTAALDLDSALSYASPEQTRGASKDSRSDLFSFGCILYEMATGTPPFRAENAEAVIARICNETPMPPRALNPEIPGRLEHVIVRALEKSQDVRYQDAAAMIADLQEVQRAFQDTAEVVLSGEAARQHAGAPHPDSVTGVTGTIGRYQIVRAIGTGGMGTVYLARDPNVGNREVAVKVISQEQAGNPAVHELFKREVHAASLLRHQNIVAVFDAGESDGHSFIVMEYIEGETLSALIRNNAPLSIVRKIELMEDLCAGLDYAHRRGIVHRDIAPANIIVGADGVLKILDFGIARVGSCNFLEGALMGKPSYMAPEQLRGEPVDARADIFAAGAVFYELLTNRRAFPGQALGDIFQQILAGAPEAIVSSVDPQLAALIYRCLNTHPEDRYPDIGVVGRELAAIRRRVESSDLATESAALVAAAPPAYDATLAIRSATRVALPETTPAPRVAVGGPATWRPMFGAEPVEPDVVPQTVDLAVPARVPVLTPMELIALIRLPESVSLQTLLDQEGETDSRVRTRSRAFGMEFLRDAAGRLTPATVTMRVVAPDFDPPRLEKTVRVRPDRGSERQTFLLTPQHVGPLRIQFDIVMGELTLASRSLETTAEPSDRLTSPGPSVVVSVPLHVEVVRRDWQERAQATGALLLKRAVALYAAALVIVLAIGFVRPFFSHDTPPRAEHAAPRRSVVVTDHKPVSAVSDGPVYALVIGIDNYTYIPSLTTAVHDATAVEAVLRERYGFATRLLKNATRYELLSAVNAYRAALSADASLLIYYAGHGYYDKDADKAYWLPADAHQDNSANWIIADDITSDIRVIPARHILVIADSCYSGGLTRGIQPVFTPQERDRYLQKMRAGTSRTLLASGGNEPVADGGGEGNHSIFASALLKGLIAIPADRFTAQELFAEYIGVSVAGRSQQTPQYVPIRNSGHDNGDFVFVRKR